LSDSRPGAGCCCQRELLSLFRHELGSFRLRNNRGEPCE
jgi:hypothetical protein